MNGKGRGRALFLALIVLVLSAALAPARAAAQENGEDVLVRVNGAVVLPVGESADVIVAVNSESQIAGSVRDTLVVVNETATISGDVGEIVVFDGVVHLEPTARIAGDLTLVNSELDQADGAVVSGRIVQRDGAAAAAELNRVVQAVSFVAWIGMTILFLALALGWATIGGRQLSAVAGLLAARPELAVGWGLVFWIAAPLLAVAVMFTVVGIPLGIATLVIGLPLLWSLGYVATGTRLGFFVDDLRGAAPDLERPYLEALIGVGILQVIGLVPIVGGFVVALAGLLGAGAVVVHAWRRTRTAGGAGGHPSPLLDAQS
jgi:hypothetical protein